MSTALSEYMQLLSKIDPSGKPQWGTMNAQQMVEHLAIVVRVSNGKIRVPQITPPEKLEKVRSFLFGEQPFPQNFKAPFLDDSQPLRTASISDAMAELEQELQAFHDHFKAEGRKETHPVFGELDHKGWDHFHCKHFTHHLTQFGLM